MTEDQIESLTMEEIEVEINKNLEIQRRNHMDTIEATVARDECRKLYKACDACGYVYETVGNKVVLFDTEEG